MDGLIPRMILVIIAIVLLSIDTYHKHKSNKSKNE